MIHQLKNSQPTSGKWPDYSPRGGGSEHPCLMSGPMVRASLADLKINTRRCVNGAGQYPIVSFAPWLVDGEQQCRASGVPLWVSTDADGTTREWGCPYGRPGDRLWVRETHITGWECDDGCPEQFDEDGNENPRKVWYAADNDAPAWIDADTDEIRDNPPWKPSIHMPRWASRLTLEITDIRVERLQDMTEEDAIAEGVIPRVRPIAYFGIKDWKMPPIHRMSFVGLWDGLNGKRPGCSWDDNPWVWVIAFRRVTPDQLSAERDAEQEEYRVISRENDR